MVGTKLGRNLRMDEESLSTDLRTEQVRNDGQAMQARVAHWLRKGTRLQRMLIAHDQSGKLLTWCALDRGAGDAVCEVSW